MIAIVIVRKMKIETAVKRVTMTTLVTVAITVTTGPVALMRNSALKK